MKKSILIIDDQPQVLQTVHRYLQGMSAEWLIELTDNGKTALQMMALKPFDVVVCDLVMPGLDGTQFLNEVQQTYPQTTRIIMCWQTERSLLQRLFGVAHQYLFKPFDESTLINLLNGVLARSQLVNDDKLAGLVSQLKNVPSMPQIYVDLVREMRSENASLQRAGEIIAKDPGMTAKILQLVNSAFFGHRSGVSSPEEAAIYLGIETIKSLVLSLQVFSFFTRSQIKTFNINQIWQHSMATALLAKRVCMSIDSDMQMADEAFTAGLLHDLGKLVLAANLPVVYQEVLQICKQQSLNLADAERRKFGASHGEIGGFLLGLWGLPDSIIEAVSLHHNPGSAANQVIAPLTAVHVANALIHNPEEDVGSPPELDFDYLATLGLAHFIPHWNELLAESQESGQVSNKEMCLA